MADHAHYRYLLFVYRHLPAACDCCSSRNNLPPNLFIRPIPRIETLNNIHPLLSSYDSRIIRPEVSSCISVLQYSSFTRSTPAHLSKIPKLNQAEGGFRLAYP